MAYEPSHADIVRVRIILLHVGIVADLIDDILDYAEYWLHSTSRALMDVKIGARLCPGLSEEYHGNTFLLRSYPVGLTGPINLADLESSNFSYKRGTIEPRPLTQACDREWFQNSVPYHVPQLDNPVRKVVFRLKSHDQGWTTHSTRGVFHDACTWFDVGIERFDANHSCDSCTGVDMTKDPPLCKVRPIEPPPVLSDKDSPPFDEYESQLRERFNKWEIQRNRVAEMQWADYEITWTSKDSILADSPEARELFLQGKNPNGYDGKFVRSLRLGDVVTVWGRCVQAGWQNFVRFVEIDIYWAA